MKILILEDDPDMGQRVMSALSSGLGADVVCVTRGEEALTKASRPGFDLLVFDRLVVGKEGLSVLIELRRLGVQTPALILSSRQTSHDKVEGLDSGADDYLGKPFEDFELVARARALLRRAEKLEHPDVRGHGPLVLTVRSRRALWQTGIPLGVSSHNKRQVSDSQFDLQLTEREFDLLLCLVEKVPDACSKEDLWSFVWNASPYIADWQRVVDVNLSRLRKKLNDRTGRGFLMILMDHLIKHFDDPGFGEFERLCDAIDKQRLRIDPDWFSGGVNTVAIKNGNRPIAYPIQVKRSDSWETIVVNSQTNVDDHKHRVKLDSMVPAIIQTVGRQGYAIASLKQLQKISIATALLKFQV